VSDVAIATTSTIEDPDVPVLLAALGALGVDACAVPWDDADFAWGEVNLAVIRSTWDYATRVDEFLAWVRSVPHLCNPADVVAWNIDKRYLDELAGAGVAVVPTSYASSGAAVEFPDGPFVVKPTVGAGSRGTARFDDGDHDAGRAHVELLAGRGLVAMVQPYLEGIEAGETAVVLIDGAVSHALTKRAPMGLDPGALPAGPTSVTVTTPTADELEVVDAVLAALPFHEPLCYARVDLVGTERGPVVLEAELIEPFLFLEDDDAAPARLARAIARRCPRPRASHRSS
jgi:glutathione synthase/RimK-type ligase-like ATP-grasp enzyme